MATRSTATLGSLLEGAEGRPSGFDYLRLVLSLLVLCNHAVALALGEEAARRIFWSVPIVDALVLSILPMFFALSGFLVAGSLHRCRTLIKFLGLRVLRIYPALVVEVLLTAFILGPFVTTLSAPDYFSSDGFYRYLLNITGHTTIFLPDAFVNNPRPEVANPQLWTVPYELVCYFALAVLAIAGGRRRRAVILAGVVASIGFALIDHGLATDWTYQAYTGIMAGRLLVVAFLCGVCFYAYRDSVGVTPLWVTSAVAMSIGLLSFTFMGQYLAIVTLSYLTCVLGLANPRRWGVLRHADLSYGIFLYHAIIQQAIIFALPGMASWSVVLITSLPLSVGMAWLSWTCVERPIMSRRQVIDRLERRLAPPRSVAE